MISNTIVISAIGFKYWSDGQKRAIVIEETLSMRAGPEAHFHTMNSIPYAHIVTVKKELPGWYKIKYNGSLGWVPDDSLDLV